MTEKWWFWAGLALLLVGAGVLVGWLISRRSYDKAWLNERKAREAFLREARLSKRQQLREKQNIEKVALLLAQHKDLGEQITEIRREIDAAKRLGLGLTDRELAELANRRGTTFEPRSRSRG